ncbi:MAG: hypothetical protein AAGG48_11275 [Planctomycetota bacterium]
MAETQARAVEDCVHRTPVESRSTSDENAAICQLLSEISGIERHPALTVSVNACQACCRSQLPSPTDPNSVVASLVVGLAEQVVSAGGVPGCSTAQARELNAWAEKCLPAVSFDEDDTHDLTRNCYRHLNDIAASDIERHLPIPEESKSDTYHGVTHWAVGITTSPRRLPTLEPCVQSVIDAGWKQPVLFIDGEVDLPHSLLGLDSCRRKHALGAFPNYVLSLLELFMRDPYAEAYVMIQDDAIFVPSTATRDYLEQVLWPFDGPCIASLYCSKKYNQTNAGWHLFPDNWIWGAVAFAFSNEAVRLILQSPELQLHRKQPGRDGLSKIDVVLGRIARSNSIPLIFPSPSLVQHIGAVSTIWDHARAVNARYASHFVGDLIGVS